MFTVQRGEFGGGGGVLSGAEGADSRLQRKGFAGCRRPMPLIPLLAGGGFRHATDPFVPRHARIGSRALNDLPQSSINGINGINRINGIDAVYKGSSALRRLATATVLGRVVV
eukprot:212019-Pyramimonas_sp.AAC.3